MGSQFQTIVSLFVMRNTSKDCDTMYFETKNFQDMFSKFACLFTCIAVMGKGLLKVSTRDFIPMNLKPPAKFCCGTGTKV